MIDILRLMEKRYSCREFSDRDISKESLNNILKAAKFSPTAKNKQPQKLFIIEKSKMNILDDVMPFRFNQNIAIVICYDKLKSWKRKFDGDDSGVVDASIITTQMMLYAQSVGIYSTWIGYFNPVMLKEKLELDENIVPVAILALGYPTESVKPSDAHFSRENVEVYTKYL